MKNHVIKSAINSALVSQGKRKGMLKAQCPRMGTSGAAAWTAIMSHANPFKVGFGQMMFMTPEGTEIFNTIDNRIKAMSIDVRSLDSDRAALESVGAW